MKYLDVVHCVRVQIIRNSSQRVGTFSSQIRGNNIGFFKMRFWDIFQLQQDILNMSGHLPRILHKTSGHFPVVFVESKLNISDIWTFVQSCQWIFLMRQSVSVATKSGHFNTLSGHFWSEQVNCVDHLDRPRSEINEAPCVSVCCYGHFSLSAPQRFRLLLQIKQFNDK